MGPSRGGSGRFLRDLVQQLDLFQKFAPGPGTPSIAISREPRSGTGALLKWTRQESRSLPVTRARSRGGREVPLSVGALLHQPCDQSTAWSARIRDRSRPRRCMAASELSRPRIAEEGGATRQCWVPERARANGAPRGPGAPRRSLAASRPVQGDYGAIFQVLRRCETRIGARALDAMREKWSTSVER